MNDNSKPIFIRKRQEILQDLPAQDKEYLVDLNTLYNQVLESTKRYSLNTEKRKEELIVLYKKIGDKLQEIVSKEKGLNVFSFSQPANTHGEISRIIAKLRNKNTPNIEFTYYIQRAFEKLFNFGFFEDIKHQKNYFEVPTPVTIPSDNLAIHKLPNLDQQLHNTVMCVMLRGALLPSMIMAKEIQEYSSIAYVPNFALFRISRNDSKSYVDMEYSIIKKSSYFDPEQLQGKDLIFADPMNATGGSILTVLEYLKEINVKPRSIKLFHAISALQGALQILRQDNNIEIYTLWLDPVLNHKAYIMPGLGDSGDRINGIDSHDSPRNILQLIAYYGQNILQLYRAQIHKIEETILGKMRE